MKKKLVALILLLALVVSGCGVKRDVKLTINNDKSLNFEVIVQTDNEAIDKALNEENDEPASKDENNDENETDTSDTTEDNQVEPTEPTTDETTQDDQNSEDTSDEENETVEHTDSERWEYIENYFDKENKSLAENGFTINRHEDGEYKGFVYTIKVDNIDDLTGDIPTFSLSDLANLKDSVLFTKSDDKYVLNITLEKIEDEVLAGALDEEIDFETKFEVTLPTAPEKNNATVVSTDGKTLTWQTDQNESLAINLEFGFAKPFNIMDYYYYIVIAVGVILIIFALLFTKKKKKGKKDKVTPQNNNQTGSVSEVVTPVQPVNDVNNPEPVAVPPVQDLNQASPQVAPIPTDNLGPVPPVSEPVQAPVQPEVTPVVEAVATPSVTVENTPEPKFINQNIEPLTPPVEPVPTVSTAPVTPAAPNPFEPTIIPTPTQPTDAGTTQIVDAKIEPEPTVAPNPAPFVSPSAPVTPTPQPTNPQNVAPANPTDNEPIETFDLGGNN